ncbi:MAG: hypothetical protein ABIQ18_16515 [Umezawaea sp.]
MPLPPKNTVWPPKELELVTGTLDVWSAWYGGSGDDLARIYGGAHDYGQYPANRPSQYRGGVVGWAARTFWGTPTPQGEKRAKLHAPLAGDIATKSSKLLFAESPAFVIPSSVKAAAGTGTRSGSTATQDRLNDLVDETFQATLLEGGEVCSGLGGVYMRVVWDRAIESKPWLDTIHADAAVPEWTYGKLKAVTFWRVLYNDGQKVWRHLERHEPGYVLHGLYEGSQDNLGTVRPLTAHPDTKDLADVVDTGVPDRLTAVYVPNIKPAKVWRNIPAGAHLGRSDYAGQEPYLDQLDETMSAWMRDVRLAKGRAFIPEVYLDSQGPGKGATFDAEREIYSTLKMLPDASAGAQITLHQFEIRWEAHQRTALELTTGVVRGAGYSLGTFGLAGTVAVTATEVVSQDRDSFLTREHKILYWRSALAYIVEVLQAVDVAQFKTAGVTPERPQIEWPDGVATDPEALARTLQLLQAAEAVSIQTKVEMLHPEWEPKQVDEEVKRIRDDSGATTADPFEIRPPGAEGKPPGEQDPPEDRPAE